MFLITPGVLPVMPDEIRIGTIRRGTAMTAICRTRCPVPLGHYPEISPGVAFSMTKISPDPFKVLSGHKESVRVLKKGNTSHPPGILTGDSYRISQEKQTLKQILKRGAKKIISIFPITNI
jgi:hypothetical protein